MTISAGSRFGHYEVVAALGAGGMGEVYRARDPRLGREVALKVLPAEVSQIPDRLARFEQEARAASALNHPNIVTIYEIGESAGSPFIAMELIDGKTLREIAVEGPLPLRRVFSIAAQAADGLARAHAAGIVHRDLKPENLMVTRDGFVKILDFGLSKLVAPASGEVSAMPTLARPETHPGTVLGTVAYMSPEQASGRDLDFRSDQFSLGAILYEIASGEKAFQHATAAETMSAIIRDEPRPILELRADTPAPFRWIVERCLAKDAEERYASTRDLARDLAAVRDRASEISGAASGVEPATRRAARRGPWAALAAVALLAGGVIGWLAAKKSVPRASAPKFQRITFRTGTIANARFGPDGKTVIYGATDTPQSSTALFEKLPGNPESRKFDLAHTDILAISPSGEMAVRIERNGIDVLARVPLSGGVPRDVLEGIGYANADWGPDGKSLAVVRRPEGRFRLEYPIGKVLVDSPRRISSPRFSPDGREIAFFQIEEAGQSVAVIGAGGGERRILSGGWADLSGVPGWTPDGREVWFSGWRIGEPAALHAADRSGRYRLVTRVPGDLELDDVSKEGRALVAHHTHFGTLMGTAPGDPKERDLSWLDESEPVDISPDGRQLLITEQGEGGGSAGAAYLRPTDGSPPVRLGDGAAATLSRDGSWAVVKVGLGRSVKPHLVILPTGAGEARSIPNDTLVDIGWVNWLPDGKRLVLVGVEAGHGPRLYVQDIAGGKPRPISAEQTRLRPFGNSVSPDGKLIVGLRVGAPPVLVPVDGGDPRPIPGATLPDIPLEWSADGRQLYVFRRSGIPAKIFLLDLQTGERRLWKEIRPSDPLATGFPNLLITPDGAAYAYRAYHFTSELFIIEGLR